MVKRMTAKEVLAASLKELAKHKNVEKITIREITGNCGYSPATFYRNFKDKYDLIAWDYVTELKERLLSIGEDGYTWQQATLRTAYYHQEHRQYLVNLFQHTSGLYSFEQYMAEANFRTLRELILSRTDVVDTLTERLIWVYCYGGVKITSDWLQGKFDASPEEMAVIYEKTVPESLTAYF